MARFLPLLLTLAGLTLLTALPILAQAPVQPADPPFVPGELLLKFRPEVAGLTIQRVRQISGIRLLEQATASDWLRLGVPPGQEALWLARLQARPDVQAVTYNYRVQALDPPNDPNFAMQWGLNNSAYPQADLMALPAWQIFTGTDRITLAIIDTGIDLDHPDLAGSLIAGYDFVNNDPLADDDNGHGSHVAGIAGAIGNNNEGITGVSWRVKLMPVKILNSGGGGSLFALAQGINYSVAQGADVINMSLGGSCAKGWDAVEEAVAAANSAGVLLVASSGNTNEATVLCPAAYAGVIAVGATDPFDERWVVHAFQGSNYGPELEVTAPGEAILSTGLNGDYVYKTGTSMAAPHVAGLASLIWSYAPALSHNEVRQVIQESSDDLGQAGWDQFFGYGRINAYRALETVSLQTPALTILNFDDNTPTINQPLAITTANPTGITWTAFISPSVAWLSPTAPLSGLVTAADSPLKLPLLANRPAAYGIYTTTVVVSGVTQSGIPLGPRQSEVRLIYLYHTYFPLWYVN
jgi:thermitase